MSNSSSDLADCRGGRQRWQWGDKGLWTRARACRLMRIQQMSTSTRPTLSSQSRSTPLGTFAPTSPASRGGRTPRCPSCLRSGTSGRGLRHRSRPCAHDSRRPARVMASTPRRAAPKVAWPWQGAPFPLRPAFCFGHLLLWYRFVFCAGIVFSNCKRRLDGRVERTQVDFACA